MFIKILLWTIAAVALLILLLLSISAMLVDPRKEYAKNSPYYRALLNISTAVGMKLLRIHVTINGKEKLPQNTRFLLVSNHRSNFDPIVTWYALREQKIAYVSKPENFKIPIFGRIIRKCCFLPIDREDARKAMGAIHSAANLLASGEVSVGIYPEGTRGKADTLLPFHNGVFKIAKKANTSIVVMSVTGTDQIWKNWYRRRSEITLNILGVIPAYEVAQRKTAEIGEIVKERITDNLIKTHRPWVKESAMHRMLHKNQILTIPNLLSVVRLLLIPVILWLYIGLGSNYWAIAVIVLSGLTDVVDGFIARKYNMVSDFGKILDPVADKLTQGALILCLTVTYAWMRWLIILFLIKECAMLIMGYLAIRKEDNVNSAQWHGKLNTVVLYGTMCMLILFPGMPIPVANVLIAACGMTIAMSFTMYIRFYIRLFRSIKQ